MDVLGDLVRRERRSGAPALRDAESGRTYDYRRFCTTGWKVGNYLRHLGVRGGSRVAIADDPVPETVVTLYGAALLGGVVRFVSPSEVDARVVVAPTATVDAYEIAPGTQRVAYGSRPADPSVTYFERDVWSENPTTPPEQVDPTAALLEVREGTYDHGEVLEAARSIADEWSLSPGETVAVRASFASPGTVVAGLVAPILAGAEILLPDDGESRGDYAVGASAPEPERLDPETVFVDSVE